MPENTTVDPSRPGYKHATMRGERQAVAANDVQVGGTHYQGGAIQHWDFAAQLPYLEGNATKYISRHMKKNGLQDLLKAAHYLKKIIELNYLDEYNKLPADQKII